MNRRVVEKSVTFTVTIDWIGTEVSDDEGADVRDVEMGRVHVEDIIGVEIDLVTVEDRQFDSMDEAAAFMLKGVDLGDWQ